MRVRHRQLAEPLPRLGRRLAKPSPAPHRRLPTVVAMHKFHVTALALLLAGAAVLGTVAVSRTTGLGAAARHQNDAAITARTRQLVDYAAKLRKQLAAKPPALPAVPKPAAAAPVVQATQAPQALPAPSAARIVYHRPPPIVVTVHHHGDDGSHDGGGRGGGDD